MDYIKQIDKIEEELNIKIVHIQTLRSFLKKLRDFSNVEDASIYMEELIRLCNFVEETIVPAKELIDLYLVDDIIPF